MEGKPSRLIVVSAKYLDAVERLIESAPTPARAKDRAAIARGKRIIAKARKTRVVGVKTTRIISP